MVWLDTIKQMLPAISNSVFLLSGILLVFGVIGIAAWWKLKSDSMYGDFATIFYRDGAGGTGVRYDRAGIFVDGLTRKKRLFLRTSKVGLDCNNIPFLTQRDGKRMVYLYQFGSKNYAYLWWTFTPEMVKVTVGEEDVNWAGDDYEKQKILNSKNFWSQFAPYIGLAIVGFIFLIFVWFLVQKLSVLADVASATRDAAVALREAKTGTIIT